MHLSDCMYGYLETFNAYILSWCTPSVIEIAHEKHKFVPGIFAIEAFEGTNFSTKKILYNKSNHKGNTCFQPIIQLATSYHNHD